MCPTFHLSTTPVSSTAPAVRERPPPPPAQPTWLLPLQSPRVAVAFSMEMHFPKATLIS